MTQPLAGLADVRDRYSVLLCDVWGVVHNGRQAFPGPCAALARWRAEVGSVLLISNSPRPASEVVRQLDGLEVPRGAWSDVVTSGDVTRALIADRAPGPAWRIAPDRDAPLWADLGLRFSSIEEARFILCTGPEQDENETPEDYREKLQAGVDRDLSMVCANPDRVVQRGDRLIYCGGALAELYAELGGRVEMAGKPYRPIYDLALERLGAIGGAAPDRAAILAIGDGVATDLAGAVGAGLDGVFIARGVHGQSHLGPDGALDIPAVEALLAREGTTARWAMADLAW